MPDALRKLWDKGYSIAELWGNPPWSGKKETSKIEDEKQLWPAMLPAIDYYEGEGQADSLLNNNLQTGIWIAIGYLSPRDAKSPLVIIPEDVFGEMQFAQSHSTVYGNGLEYVGVRILHTKLLDEEKSETSHRKPGRPSQKDEILNAYAALKNRGAINYDHPFARLVPQIRNTIAKKRGIPDNQLHGVGKEVIRKTLARQFEKDRSSP